MKISLQGFAMHKQTRVHCIALANSQDADKDEEPDDMETEASGGSGQGRIGGENDGVG